MTRLGVAVWGLGEHARRNIIPAFQETDLVDLVGVLSRSEVKRNSVADEAGVTAYSDRAAMFADSAVEVVFLAAATGMHTQLGEEVLRESRHLWCEKPLAATQQERARLLALGRARHRSVMEAAMFLHHPQFLKIQDLLKSGAIGTVESMTARFGFPHLDPLNFRYQVAEGGGALLDAGFYPIAIAQALLPAPLEVVGSVIGHGEAYEVDISGSALLRAPAGEVAHLEWGFGRAYRNELEVWGSEGSLRATRVFSKPPSLSTSIELVRSHGDERIDVAPANHFAAMLDSFALQILNDEPSATHGAVGDRSRLIGEIARGDHGPTR